MKVFTYGEKLSFYGIKVKFALRTSEVFCGGKKLRKKLKTGIERKSRFTLAVTFNGKSKTSLAGLSANLTSATAETSLFANGKKINLKIKFLSLFLHGQGRRFFL